MATNIFKLVGSIYVDNADANKSIEDTGRKAESTGEKISSVVGNVAKFTAGVTTAVAGAGTAMVGLASSYDTAFAKVNTLLTGSADYLEDYKQQIIDASNETGMSVEDFSEAVYGAISAGVDQQNAVKFVTQSMKLAKGGFTDTAHAVDILTTAINAYGLEQSDAMDIADKLITTQNLGKTTVNELASSMGKIIPTAKTFGVNLDQLSAMYVTMTSNGIATAEATTYMNSMLNELGKSGTTADVTLHKMTEHIKEGGMSFSEMMDAGWDLSDVLSLLDEDANELGLSMMDMFGSSEAGKSATVLWDNAQKMNDALESMEESAGATQTAFEVMDDTMQARLDKLKNNLKNVGIQIGEKLMPIAESVFKWVEAHMPQIEAFLQIVFEKFGAFIEDAKIWIKNAWDFISPYIPIIKETVSNLITEIKDIWENTFKPIFDRFMEFMVDTFLPTVKKVLKFFAPFIETMYKSIRDTIKDLKDVFIGIIDFLDGVFTLNWEKIWNGIVSFTRGIAKTIEDILGYPVKLLKTAVDWISGEDSGGYDDRGGATTTSGSRMTTGTGKSPFMADGGIVARGGTAIVGEAGAELLSLPQGATVTPLNDRNNAFTETNKKLDSLVAIMSKMLEKDSAPMGVYINGGALVGEIAPNIDNALGRYARSASRGV